ncbi:hypothetical protein TSOC_002984 [Tetrabaena socialis]|uniref:Post-GPI attachment to proteins factor 3 n=1 Tax=Tetrabaena socialis TaxID=47790 RepID=A0A2J8ACQ5_9CHLO|nr:hypothetical protein TSOC_002984 [Tetrabaena socialis]|eukprot:PNH10298.1 hypothetical protein TSOC_002984 [Tetrabaena socialis]
MSAEFIDVFFPSTSRLLRTTFPDAFDAIFPPELQRSCASPAYVLPIRWPSLVPLTLLGVGVGAFGLVQCRADALKPRRPSTPALSLSFAFYSLMNFSALLAHCLLPREHFWQPILVALDIASTACCSCSALYGCRSRELEGALRWGSAQQQRRSQRRQALTLAAMNCLLCAAAFFGPRVPFLPELLYIGSACIAAAVVGTYVRGRPTRGRQALWRALLFGGGALAGAGVPLDARLCAVAGPHINCVVVLFAGCHLIMFALAMYVRDELRVSYDEPRVSYDDAAKAGGAAGRAGRDKGERGGPGAPGHGSGGGGAEARGAGSPQLAGDGAARRRLN